MFELEARLHSPLNEGKLIWTWRLVLNLFWGRWVQLIFLHVHYDGVADTEQWEEIWKLSISLKVTFTIFLLIKVTHVIKYFIDATLAHSRTLTCLRTVIYTIDLTIDGEFLEYHLVLSECASFVGEHELDLPELLNQIWVPALRHQMLVEIRVLVLHRGVNVNEVTLAEFQQLNHDIEWDGDHVAVGDPVGEEVDEPGACVDPVILQWQVGVLRLRIYRPVNRYWGEGYYQDDLEGEDGIEHLVHHKHDLTDFPLRFLRILHYFGVSTHIDDNTIDIVNVPEGAAT
jgi:hypothetical protein